MNHDFIEFKIPPEMLAIAVKEGEKLGELRNSITRGEGNTAGLLGELVAEAVTGYTRNNTRDYDLVNPNDPTDTADVKTKRCSSPPESHFSNSIASYNTQQKCRKYVFVRINRDYQTAWVCGELNKEDYFKKAVFIQQGQFDPSNNWRSKADCYNVLMEDLDPPTILKKHEDALLQELNQVPVIVNGCEKFVTQSELSYADVVKLAFDEVSEVIYSMTYHNKDRNQSGILTAGQSVAVAPGLILNVAFTGNA